MAENTQNLTNEAENSNNSNKNNKRNMRYVFLIVVLCMLVGVFGIAAGYFSNYHENSETASHDTVTTLSTLTDEDGSLYADFPDGTGKEGVSSNIEDTAGTSSSDIENEAIADTAGKPSSDLENEAGGEIGPSGNEGDFTIENSEGATATTKQAADGNPASSEEVNATAKENGDENLVSSIEKDQTEKTAVEAATKSAEKTEAEVTAKKAQKTEAEVTTKKAQKTEEGAKSATGDCSVSKNGQLKVIGTHLCNKDGNQITLRGMSTHGIMWFPQFATAEYMENLQSEWGASVFRIAMYDQEGNESYINSPDTNKKKVCTLVDAAIALDSYVIVDWHILADGNPQQNESYAKEFFGYMAKKYAEVPNVIYEICNEPNGGVTWSANIKPYAEDIIPIIRKYSPDAIIIVGSSNWSQDVDVAAGSSLSYDNIMYSLHFYAGTHKADLRNKAKKAINAGLALFVTEWGTTDASGNGNVDTASSDEWLTFLEENGISWCNWSLCNKNESSAALKSSATANGSVSDSVLSTSGAYVKKAMLKYSGADTTSGKTKVTPTPKVTAARTSDIKDDNSPRGIELYQFNQDKNDETSTLSPMFKVVNNSGKSVELSNIEIYYYFNPDGNVDTVYEVDYADINGSSGYKALTSAVKGTFKEAGTKSYIKITFSLGAGTLVAGDTVQIQGRIHSESWGMYTQSNDASFLSDAEDYTLKNACKLVVK